MITEQPDVAARTIQPGRGKIGFPLRGPRDGKRIDGIGLAVGASRVTNVSTTRETRPPASQAASAPGGQSADAES